MKESLAKINKNCIFKETFSSEEAARMNGGIPTANAVFNKGVLTTINGTPTYINYKKKITGTFTVRMKLKIATSLATVVFFDSVRDSGYFDIYLNSTKTLTSTNSSIIYVNTIVTASSSLSLVPGITYDICVVTTSNISSFNVGANIAGLYTPSFTIELLEIYNGTLTPEEVKNLYQNRRYKKFSPHGEILGSELAIGGDFSSSSGWNITGEASISNGICNIKSTAGAPSAIDRGVIVLNKVYRLSYNVLANRGGLLGTDVFSVTPLPSTVGYQSLLVVATSTTIHIKRYSGIVDIDIDNLSLKEVLSTANLILDVDAFDGVIKNRLSGGFTNNVLANSGFDTNTIWTLSTGWTILDGLLVGTNVGNSVAAYQTVGVSGKKYIMTFTLVSCISGGVRARIGTTSTSVSQVYTMPGTYSFTNISDSTILAIIADSAGFSGTVDNVIVQEVIPPVINRAVSVVNDGGINVMRFNGSNSRLDLGSYHNLLGDLTITFWFKIYNWGKYPSGIYRAGTIIENGIFRIVTDYGIWATSAAIDCFSAAGAYPNSGSYTVKLNVWTNMTITRKSNGKTSFFLNGVSIGVVDQTGNVPALGTTNIFIGDRSDTSNTTYGNIAQLQIYQGILNNFEISEKFSQDRNKYNI